MQTGRRCFPDLGNVVLGHTKDYDSRRAPQPKAKRARIQNRMWLGAPVQSAGEMVSLGPSAGFGGPRSVQEPGLGQSEPGLPSRRPIIRLKTPESGTLPA